jgi:hypothetical protein
MQPDSRPNWHQHVQRERLVGTPGRCLSPKLDLEEFIRSKLGVLAKEDGLGTELGGQYVRPDPVRTVSANWR